MPISSQPYGKLPCARPVKLYTLTNNNGLSAQITNYGAILVSLFTPDNEGKMDDVVLGKDSLEDYLAGHPYFGSTCGRVAGRIGGARFEIGGQTYLLEPTEGQHGNSLHGGSEGFNSQLWNAEVINDNAIEKLKLSIIDSDGHNGYPGTLNCSVTYAMLEDDSLQIEYQATCDQISPFNPTNHSYFNLRGNGDILGHSIQIFADSVATVDKHSTLIGRRDPVKPNYNDYREPVCLGKLDNLDVGNADIHFFLNKGRTSQPKTAAIVREPTTGRVMQVLTTEPGVQFYAGLFLSADEPDIGKGGVRHDAKHAFCLETQDYADSINYPKMGNAIIRPGETYSSTTIFRFSTESAAT